MQIETEKGRSGRGLYDRYLGRERAEYIWPSAAGSSLVRCGLRWCVDSVIPRLDGIGLNPSRYGPGPTCPHPSCRNGRSFRAICIYLLVSHESTVFAGA